MRTVMGFWLVCAIACAGKNSPPLVLPTSSPVTVDPVAEIVAIPPGICPGLDDHYALSTAAVRALLVNERNAEAEHAAELVTCQGAAKVAELRQKGAETALDGAGWWARWHWPVTAVGTVLGIVGGFLLGRVK